MTTPGLRVAVLVPCFNEDAAVATVVADFRKALPAETTRGTRLRIAEVLEGVAPVSTWR